MTELWGDLIVSDDSLFKVIQDLRKLFKDNGLVGDILVNVYGKGYKISPSINTLSQREQQINADKNLLIMISRQSILIAVIALIVLVLITYYYTQNQTLLAIDSEAYSEYKEKINNDPNKFLLSTRNDLQALDLNKNSLINFYSLEGFAHFTLGQYKKTLEYYDKAIILADGETMLSIADNYLFMAKIYYYRANEKKSTNYINKAHEMYLELNNQDGIFDCGYIFLNLKYLAKDYEQEIIEADLLFKKAQINNHAVGKIYALLHLYYANFSLNHREKAETYVLEALDIALEISDSKFISICYGILAEESLDQGNFINAMKWANETLKHAVVQPSTNNFMQGFSYMYNALSPLGHNQLAEKYIQKGIDLQNHLNSEGHLYTAEINLGILKIKLQKFQEAKIIFSKLATYNLSTLDSLTAEAWKAVNYVKMHDNISAYSTAKKVYYDSNVSDKSKFIAGIALVQSASELERFEEADLIFRQIYALVNSNWLIAYEFYLDMALSKFDTEDDDMKNLFTEKKKQFQEQMVVIKARTQPDRITLKELDDYLAKILD